MSIFNDDEEEDFTPQDPKEERIKKFLSRIHSDVDDERMMNRRSKRKLIDVVFKLGINDFIHSFPKVVKSDLFENLITDLYNHYTKSKFDDIKEIDIENIIYVVKYYENDEEYEKCHELTELYIDIDYGRQ
jgi:hypothetical protein